MSRCYEAQVEVFPATAEERDAFVATTGLVLTHFVGLN